MTEPTRFELLETARNEPDPAVRRQAMAAYLLHTEMSEIGDLVSAGEGNEVRLWKASTGKCLRTFRDPDWHDSVYSVALSPLGQTMASASADAHLWNTATGELRHTLSASGIPRSVAFSSDGKTVALGGSEHRIQIWDVASGEMLRTIEGHTDRVRSVVFSSDDQTIASASADKTIRAWRPGTGEVLHILEADRGDVRCVAFSPDGQVIASGYDDGVIRLWKTDSGALLRTLKGHMSLVSSVAFSPDGRTFASGSWHHTVRIWNTATGKSLRGLEGHEGNVQSVAYSPDGQVIASGSDDKTVRLWNAATGELLRTLTGHWGGVRCVAFSRVLRPDLVELDPADVAAALLLLLEENKEHRDKIVELLAEWGAEAAVAPLLEIADAFFGDDELKAAAREAANRIVERQGGLRAGGLSVSADDTRAGGVSVVDEPDEGSEN
jgi:WD40 repeat protein